MKNKLVLLAILLMSINAFSQNCIIDTTITEPGIYPDMLDTAYVNKPYSFTIQVLAIKDTIANLSGTIIRADIDSITLDTINGLPGSFTFSCEPVGCVFDHTSVGCILLSGNPIISDAGLHDLEIITTAYATAGPLKLPVKDTISDYALVVKDTGALSVFNVVDKAVSLYPNPTNNGTFVIESKSKVSNLQIVDLQGRSMEFSSNKTNNSLIVNLNSNTAGLYFVRFSLEGKIFEKRIIQ